MSDKIKLRITMKVVEYCPIEREVDRAKWKKLCKKGDPMYWLTGQFHDDDMADTLVETISIECVDYEELEAE